MLPADPFARTAGIVVTTAADDAAARARNVAEWAAVMQALIDGTPPPRHAALRIGAAGLGWLEHGGQLDRHLGMRTPNGRRDTPQRLHAAQRRRPP